MRHNLLLLKELVKRDFQGRYAGSMLGLVWSLLQPLWQLVLFTFIFSTVMKITPVGARTEHFAIFLFSGLLPWMAMQEGVLRSSTAITDNAGLVKKLRFPSEVLVVAVVLAALVHEAIAVVIFLVALAWVGELSWGGLPLLLVAAPLQVGLTLGLGLLAASAQVFLRDTSQILGILLNAWFYLTPIVYPLPLVPERFRWWLELNPLTTLVGLYRQALLEGRVVLVPRTAPLALGTAVVLCAGFWLFRRLKPAFVDEI
ncbi:MAG TPA: ABC transporter permease [Thermoanaerobaculia bacterium]|nr:ABC transporter permease [Thermoanaerobaculia bacterium]